MIREKNTVNASRLPLDDRSGVIERVDHVKNITSQQYKSWGKKENVCVLMITNHYFCFFDEVQVSSRLFRGMRCSSMVCRPAKSNRPHQFHYLQRYSGA